MQNLDIKAGEVIVFTVGEYSDYGIAGYCVATTDFNLQFQLSWYLSKKPFESYDDNMQTFKGHNGFIAYLIYKEFVVPVAHREIHLGTYSELKLS